jgi:hypothetical protein
MAAVKDQRGSAEKSAPNKTPPPPQETVPKQTPHPEANAALREQEPAAKKLNPPPRETKPSKDGKDKDKDKDLKD